MNPEIVRRAESRASTQVLSEGVPVIEGIDHVALGLSETERSVLGQIDLIGDLWSVNSMAEVAEQVVNSFVPLTGEPCTAEMIEEARRESRETILSLESKGLVEQVPDQVRELPSDAVCWRIKK